MRLHNFWCISFVSGEFLKHIQKTPKSWKGLFNYDFSSESRKNTFTGLKNPQNCLFPSHPFFRQSWAKVWDTFAFLGRFPIYTGPTPPLTPQTMLDECIQNFFPIFNFL